MKKFLLLFVLSLVSMAALVTLAALFSARREIPTGQAGPAAQDLALKIQNAVGVSEWLAVGVVSFSIAPADRSYFWDRTHHFLEAVVTSDSQRIRILCQLDARLRPGKTLVLRADGTKVPSARADEISATFREVIATDISLLFPWSGLSDSGDRLEKIGEQALLVRRAGGKETILVITDKSGLPVHWKTWKKGILIQGIETIFESWSPTKPRIARIRRQTAEDVEIRDLELMRTAPDPAERFLGLLEPGN